MVEVVAGVLLKLVAALGGLNIDVGETWGIQSCKEDGWCLISVMVVEVVEVVVLVGAKLRQLFFVDGMQRLQSQPNFWHWQTGLLREHEPKRVQSQHHVPFCTRRHWRLGGEVEGEYEASSLSENNGA